MKRSHTLSHIPFVAITGRGLVRLIVGAAPGGRWKIIALRIRPVSNLADQDAEVPNYVRKAIFSVSDDG